MGTRLLRVNIKAIVGLMRWPFPKGTTVHIHNYKLPDDATFIKIVKVEEPYITVLLKSREWHGHTDLLLENPQFKYESAPGHIALPSLEEIIRGGPN